jgi:putative flavoprotein involved in K+ transport
MSMPEVVGYLEGFARAFSAPVETGVGVLSVEASEDGFRVRTDTGEIQAGNVVIATGHCDVPHVPGMAAALPGWVYQLTPTRYRAPDQLPPGNVLIVGASASGVQLADEILRSGRRVTLAAGRHSRLPRCYRGRDILWWLEETGVLDEGPTAGAPHPPSLQLVGRPDHASLDLPTLQARGARLVGRATGIQGPRVRFADDLVVQTVAADVKMARLLHRIDGFVAEKQLEDAVEPGEPFVPFLWPHPAPTEIDLGAEDIRTVVWATGFRRRYPWLQVPAVDGRGEILHEGGVTPVPGLYVIGLNFLRRRKSSFIDGVAGDAAALAEHIVRRVGTGSRAVA